MRAPVFERSLHCRDTEIKLQLFEPLIISIQRNWDYTKFDEKMFSTGYQKSQVHADYVY